MFVPIVNNPQEGITEDNIIIHEGKGVACKHLSGDKPGEYSCSIHDEIWYEETPCARHGQIERNLKTRCRLGVYQMTKSNDKNNHPHQV